MLRLVLGLICLLGIASGNNFRFPLNTATPACIRVEMEASFVLKETGTSKQDTFTDKGFQAVDGQCAGNGTSSTLKLNNMTSKDNISFAFNALGDAVTMSLTYTFFENGHFGTSEKKAVVLTSQTDIQVATKQTAYKCDSSQKIMFANAKATNYTMEMTVRNVKLQAFNLQEGKFSQDDVCAMDQVSSEAPSEGTTAPPTETTEHSSETPEPDTTPTTKPAPVTTEPTPDTTETTPPSNETTPQTTETTPKETTATTPHTSPMTTPNPADAPLNKFNVSNGNVTCIEFWADIQFAITYETSKGNTAISTIGVPANSKVSGNCSAVNGTQTLVVTFDQDLFVMTVTFSKDSSSAMLTASDDGKFSWSKVNLDYNMTEAYFPNMKSDMGNKMMNANKSYSDMYQAAAGGSYKCNAKQTLDLNKNVSMVVTNLQYFAYSTTNTTSFGSGVTECSADTKTNSVVPIAVGAALAGLVVIVLIAYLIGRRRNRKGYESV